MTSDFRGRMTADWPHTERGKPADERAADALERIAAAAESLVRVPARDDRYAARLAEVLLRALPERDVKEVR